MSPSCGGEAELQESKTVNCSELLLGCKLEYDDDESHGFCLFPVFQKKKTTLQGDGDLYSLPSKQGQC